MATWLKQSTAVDVKVGPFLDETDGKTAETALTITQPDIRLAKNGGAFAQKNAAQTLTHEEAGWYEVALDTTDTNTLGILILAIHESGALPVWREFMVVPANVYDSLISGSDALQVHTNEITADLITASVIANGAIDAGAIAADAITAAKIADGAIDAATFAAGAITATVIATGAIDADALAADAVAEIADGVWDEPTTGHTTLGTAGQALRAVALPGEINDAAGTTTAFVVDGFTEATNDHFNGMIITFTSGALTGQSRTITDYVGATQTITVAEALTDAPADNDDFIISPGPMAGGTLQQVSRLFLTVLNSSGQIQAGTLANDAITDAKVAADVTIASVTGAVGSVTAGVTVAAGGISSGSFAAGAIDAAAIAANAIGASEIATGAIDADALAADAVDEIWDEAIGDTTITARQAMKILVAALAGKLSGAATTTVTIRNAADTTDVIVATVDADGNRSAVTLTV